MINGNSYIGKRIGNYRLVEKLACGSFGCVYRAEHASFPNRIVAVKLLHTQIASQGVREEFLREAQPLEKLKHPHILSIIDTDIDGELPYLVTEYAYKGSLRGRLNLNQQSSQLLPMSEAITILTQIGEALQYAHDKGVIHRDIKPENILFNAEGEAILADFGISIVTDSTTRADLVGTCPYMAPEQFQGIVSKKSDQYALGCVAYELFTGNRPFTLPPDISPNTAWFVWANIHTHELPILPRQHNPQLPLYIEQTILKSDGERS